MPPGVKPEGAHLTRCCASCLDLIAKHGYSLGVVGEEGDGSVCCDHLPPSSGLQRLQLFLGPCRGGILEFAVSDDCIVNPREQRVLSSQPAPGVSFSP